MKTKKFLYLLLCFYLFVPQLFSQTVYITKTGEKYHVESCRYLSKSKIEISLPEALDRGYTPCKVCKPQIGVSKSEANTAPKSSSSINESKTKNYSSQCTAITMKGIRCKRKAQSGSNYCWQHGR